MLTNVTQTHIHMHTVDGVEITMKAIAITAANTDSDTNIHDG